MFPLLLIAASTFVSEDLACIGAGVLVSQGRLSFFTASLACFAGIFAGDFAILLAGRFAAYSLLRRQVTSARLRKAREWLTECGLSVILLSRFTPGLRVPTYFAAGLIRLRMLPVTAWLLLACALWTPLLVGASALGVQAPLFVGPIVVIALRMRRWEFWPNWAIYLPLVPWIAWLGVRYRSLTLFTAANPGIPTGGFVGESKSAILRGLACAARHELIPGTLTAAAKVDCAVAFLRNYPVVLKPDVGERGTGVAIVRDEFELRAYLEALADTDIVIQDYVSGVEFGVFYERHPADVRGRITSITGKRFPAVIGDGRSTFEQLIRADDRARRIARTYLKSSRRDPASVPADGERVPLVEIGSHCRGTIFVDARRLTTPALEAAIERISRSRDGFYFGRYDVRADSVEAFQRGEVTVLELNGVTGEPTHVYDPAVSLWSAYRTLFRHWRVAFEIGAAHRAAGARPTPFAELVRAVRQNSKTTRNTDTSRTFDNRRAGLLASGN